MSAPSTPASEPAWRSWSGRVRATPARREAPRDEAEVIAAVQRAARDGLVVRVAGAGHSHTPLVASEGVLLSVDALSGIESFDADSLEATIGAGARIHDLGEPLRRRGGALANQGDVDTQALAGAVATGTHGTGPTLGSLSSRVVGFRWVDGTGAVREWSECDQGDRFDGARVSLGLFGVVTALRIRLVPPYRLHERIWRAPVDETLERLDALVPATRHFEFFWMPSRDVVEIKTLHPTDAPAESDAGSPDASPAQASSSERRDRRRERIDWSHRIFPSIRDVRFNEMEYAVPAEAGPACFRAVRDRMRARHPDVVWPVEYRTLAADTAWLGPAHGRATVTISLHQAAELPCDPCFSDVEAIFREHGGRPHWGKVHFRTGAELATLYPHWEDFRKLRRELDPEDRFLNPYLRSLFEPASAV
jgi:FAD/FMN-containing dehydrogenase